MIAPMFEEPSHDEQFYARALAILAGPSRRVALFMRLCNLIYWAAVISALGWLCAQVIDRQVPVVVRNATLLTPQVVAGEPVRVSYVVSRVRTCETDVTWSIYDGVGEIHRFGPMHVSAPGLPGTDTFIKGWATPGIAAAGNGRLRVVLAFACPGNYLQAIYPVTMVLPDLPFTITAAR